MTITADDVLQDIAFELAQSTLARDDIAKAIDDIRRQQHQTRDAVLRNSAVDARAIALQQFQLNDMLLAVLHELALNVRAVQHDMRNVARAPAGPAAAGPAARLPPAMPPAAMSAWLSDALRAVQNLPGNGLLQTIPDVRPVQVPVIGALLTRLRGMVHRLPVFYVNRMAAQQAVANQALSDALLQIAQEQARLRTLLEDKPAAH